MPNGQVIASSVDDPTKLWGIANKQILALDSVAANDVGMWMPLLPFHKGSLEAQFDPLATGTVSLMVSNAPTMPANGFDITIGGSITPGDVLQITASSPAFFQPGVVGQCVVQGGDTHATIATRLAAALTVAIKNAGLHEILGQDANLAASVLKASHLNAVVSLTWAYPLPASALPIAIVAEGNVGATETMAITQYDSGEGFVVTGATLTTSGNVAFDHPASWVKTALPDYGGSGPVSAILQLVIP